MKKLKKISLSAVFELVTYITSIFVKLRLDTIIIHSPSIFYLQVNWNVWEKSENEIWSQIGRLFIYREAFISI